MNVPRTSVAALLTTSVILGVAATATAHGAREHLVPAPTVGAALTPAQQQTKDAICLAFNDNSIAPIAWITRKQMEEGCPSIAV